MRTTPHPSDRATLAAVCAVAAALAGCSSVSLHEPPRAATSPSATSQGATPQPPAQAAAATAPAAASSQPAMRAAPSTALDARTYRRDAAGHLYTLNRERIFAGRLPPMLYAIGVLQVDLDAGGNVRQLQWLRAPRHAPEVISEIERTVRSAAPFPVPLRMARGVSYVDTWLWDKSGRFQLDTLTEGQD